MNEVKRIHCVRGNHANSGLYIGTYLDSSCPCFCLGISKTLRICRLSVGNLEALVKPILTAKWPGSTKPKHFVISEGSCKLKSMYSMNTLWGGFMGYKQNHSASSPWFGHQWWSKKWGLSVNLSTASASLSVYNQGRFVPGPPGHWSWKPVLILEALAKLISKVNEIWVQVSILSLSDHLFVSLDWKSLTS